MKSLFDSPITLSTLTQTDLIIERSEEMILEVNDKLIMGGSEIETYEYSTISLQHVNHPNTTSQKYLARTAVGTIRSISTIFER